MSHSFLHISNSSHLLIQNKSEKLALQGDVNNDVTCLQFSYLSRQIRNLRLKLLEIIVDPLNVL